MQALKDYADLEYELCILLKEVLRVQAPIASAIFYQISATRTRYAIIGSGFDINHQPFKKAWDKMERWLGPLDTARNHIVHWGQDIRVITHAKPGKNGGMFEEGSEAQIEHALYLKNRTRLWRGDADQLSYTEEELRDWAWKFRTMMHVINRLGNCVRKPKEWPWTDIFQRPITDLKPEVFLSRLNDAGHPVLP